MITAIPESLQTIAVVSGKGGSGKTLMVTAMAQGFAMAGKRVLLVDADFGTGGLTYYLGFNIFSNSHFGLSDFVRGKGKLIDRPFSLPESTALDATAELKNIKLLPVGSHMFNDHKDIELSPNMIKHLICEVAEEFDVILFDCRGGIDEQSLAVCAAVKNILIVVETDAASIQASTYLSDSLARCDMKSKILGFVLNKVMDDPTHLANAGRSFFQARYLGAIPFDLDTTRKFIKGDFPSPSSIFSKHVCKMMSIFDEKLDEFAKIRVFSPSRFS